MFKFKENKNSVILLVFAILALSFTRLIPHPWNFSPMIAAGIFAGFYFRHFYLGSFVIILSMFLGDLFLGLHNTMFLNCAILDFKPNLLTVYSRPLKKVLFDTTGFLGAQNLTQEQRDSRQNLYDNRSKGQCFEAIC